MVIGSGARIGDRVGSHPHVVIGRGAASGPTASSTHACPFASDRSIGARVILQDGAVIGSDGFGFVPLPDGTHRKIPQVARSSSSKTTWRSARTRPSTGRQSARRASGRGTKIDNLVQIAHGVRVGAHSLLAAQVGIAGSTVIGDHVTLAGQVGVAGHITIGDHVIATAQSGIPNSVEARSIVSGYPAVPNREWLKSAAMIRRLPELRRQLTSLAVRLDALEARLGKDRPDGA